MNPDVIVSELCFLDIIDQETRDGVMRLDTMLTGMHAEITNKLQDIELLSDEASQIQKQHLFILKDEILRALAVIHDLATRLVPDAISKEDFLKENQDSIDLFREMIVTNVSKIEEELPKT